MPRYLQGNKPQEERAIQNRTQARVANAAAPDFEAEIMRAFEEAASEYRRWESETVIESILEQHNETMSNLVEKTWIRSGRLAGERTLGAVNKHMGMTWETKQEEGEMGIFMEIFRSYIIGEALVRAVGLGLTTMKVIRDVIFGAKQRGESVDGIAKAILNQGSIDSKYRAMMIARTESHSAYNTARQAAAEASPLTLSKEWVSSDDGRTRDFGNGKFSHRQADGEIVLLNEKFVETGEALRFPGDPSGSAGNVIHCRCGTVDVLD